MAYKKKRFVQNPGNTAICYYRYSSAAQRDVSIEDQRKAAHEYAEAHGLHIIKEYEDHAISGTTDERPDFQLMLYEADKLKASNLILWKTDRLSRDKIDATLAKKRLRDCGTKIVYVAEAIPENDDEAEVLLESLYEAMAQMFIIAHRKNVIRGLSGNAERAWFNGIKVLGYSGKPNEKYQVDEETAPIVKRIYSDYAEGKPLKHICDELNSAGLRTIKGNEFTINSLRHILTNRSYIGEYKWGECVIKDGMPRLITDEMFEKVQQRLDENKRGGKGALKDLVPDEEIADYWLTNHIYCKECGGTLQGVSGTSKSGKLHYYYSCKNHRRHKCSLKNQRKDLLERIVNYVLEDLLHDSALRIIIASKCYEYYAAQNDASDSCEKSIKAKIKEVENKLNNFTKAIEMGIFNETTQKRMRELELQKSLLSDELIIEQNRKNMVLTREQVLKYLDTFLTESSKEELLEYLVDKIYIGSDKISMVLRYTDDTRELSYKEAVEMIENSEMIDGYLKKCASSTAEPTPEMMKLLDSVTYPGIKGDEDLKSGGGGDPYFFQ